MPVDFNRLTNALQVSRRRPGPAVRGAAQRPATGRLVGGNYGVEVASQVREDSKGPGRQRN